MFFFDPWIKGAINFLAILILSSSPVTVVKRTSPFQLFQPKITPYFSLSYNTYRILTASKYIQNSFSPIALVQVIAIFCLGYCHGLIGLHAFRLCPSKIVTLPPKPSNDPTLSGFPHQFTVHQPHWLPKYQVGSHLRTLVLAVPSAQKLLLQ